ncbi:MAG: PEP/pyruvate-binding domain-containing protein [Acidobacteriota bacterium]
MFSKELFRRWTYQVFAPGVLLREKYNAFRELLRYDDACLELIAAIEDIHYGGVAVDWTRVVHLTRRLRTSVGELVERLTRLSPSRHLDLPEYARKVDFYVQMALDLPAGDMSPPFVLPLAELAGDLARAGGKAANLARAAAQAQVPIPDGFVAITGAFRYFLEACELRPAIDRLLRRVDLARPDEVADIAAELRALILAAPVPGEVAGPIAAAAARLGNGPDGPVLLAARSSAVAEDGRASFAGQYQSLLGVDPAKAVAAFRQVVAGKYSAKAITYRVLTGYADEETPMAVLFLPMVAAVASGVLYTRDCADPDAPMAVYAVPGLGADLVEGSASPERLVLSHDPPHFLLDRQTLDAPVLSEAAAGRLAALGLRLERTFGAPQDVEWVVGPDGAPVILQSRPMAVEGIPILPAGPMVRPPEGLAPLISGGMRASGGCAAGIVRFAATILDVETIAPGTVLVTPTLPTTLARAVDRLAAVIAVSGSRAGHFASVAREFGLPVVTGVEDAFSALTEDAEVTVDADAGLVYPGRIAALLGRPAAPRAADGSPVAERLARLTPLVAGLTLTDPSSPDFTPARVRSLHDVVRFAHEKAVTEMFSLVGESGRGLASAKRLASHLPLTMYILDLGGGVFDAAANDKELRPDQIKCAPMWALWSGLAADDAPWPPGPPVTDDETLDRTSAGIFFNDSKHLASYAVISDNYAHVMLRFGYHFTVVDALCGPDDNQNYVNFRFKGGGAEFGQRTLRLACVRRVLTHFGFSVRASGDLLDASLTRVPEQVAQKRLAMLGCLLAATRMLDIRLPSETEADAWVEDFLRRTDR